MSFNAFNNSSIQFSTRMSKIEMPLDVIIYGCVFYSIIYLIGVTGNLLVIYVLLKEKQLRSFTNYLLANLSIADLMVLFICVPSAFHDLFAKERWYLGKIPCYLISFVENCMGIASILSLFMITFERYYVICRPLNVKSLITKSHILKLIGAIWVISIGINIPFIFLTEYKLAKFFDKNTTDYKCVAKPTNEWSLSYIILMNFGIYFLIAIVMLLMYKKISTYLNCSNKLLALQTNLLNKKRKSSIVYNNMVLKADENLTKNSISLNYVANNRNGNEKSPRLSFSSVTQKQNEDMPTENIFTSKSNYEKYIKPRRQLIFMIMWVIVVFYVSLFPFKIWTLILMFFGHKKSFPRIITLRTYWYINITSRIFFYINSSINPILYNSLSLKFRRSFRNLGIIKCCFKESDNNGSTEYDDNTNIQSRKSGQHLAINSINQNSNYRNNSSYI